MNNLIIGIKSINIENWKCLYFDESFSAVKRVSALTRVHPRISVSGVMGAWAVALSPNPKWPSKKGPLLHVNHAQSLLNSTSNI